MADISKIILPSGSEYNIKDTTARSDLSGKQATITASGVLIGDGSGGVTAKTLDTSSLTNDNNHVPTSGVVKSALNNVEALTAIPLSDPAAASIAEKKYVVYQNGLYKTNAAISSGETATTFASKLDAVTEGGLNAILSPDFGVARFTAAKNATTKFYIPGSFHGFWGSSGNSEVVFEPIEPFNTGGSGTITYMKTKSTALTFSVAINELTVVNSNQYHDAYLIFFGNDLALEIYKK